MSHVIRIPLAILCLAVCLVLVGAGKAWSAPAWSAQQRANARVITQTALQQGVGVRGAQIAVMTAIQESSLEDVAYGDEAGPDSRGLFQQRDPWGPLSVRMDPAGATGLFVAQMKTVNYWSGDPGEVAQAVQVSAYPDAYAEHWQEAGELVAEVAK